MTARHLKSMPLYVGRQKAGELTVADLRPLCECGHPARLHEATPYMACSVEGCGCDNFDPRTNDGPQGSASQRAEPPESRGRLEGDEGNLTPEAIGSIRETAIDGLGAKLLRAYKLAIRAAREEAQAQHHSVPHEEWDRKCARSVAAGLNYEALHRATFEAIGVALADAKVVHHVPRGADV